ncbi:MAG: hypothetical protein K0M40_09845 [Prolixibacteraceae bacterium]|nr:hypothetical protein [Prolixibacteraceae bacterium]
MKATIKKISLMFLLFSLMGVGCEKEEGEWIQIDSLTLNEETDIQLNSIFSSNNNCLLNFQKDTIYHVIFNQNELRKFDNCNSIPEIDFSKYTLIAGRVMVSSISDNISSIILTSNKNNASYNLKVSILEPQGRYGAIGYLYFWKVYPRLETIFEFKLLVTKN